mmetsp:Transcript_4051/g.7774  ORF Transcript_4051/g.7774 Transcript_4051/m.7774 type:complete len:290 (+) Transcript_4051:75-944(+)
MGGFKVVGVACPLADELDWMVASSGKRSRKEGADSVDTAYQAPEGKRFVRYLYVKAHGSASKTALFVANIDKQWEKADVEQVFGAFGAVEKVELGNAEYCSFAVVHFENAKKLKRVIDACSDKGRPEPAFEWNPEPTKPGKRQRPAWLSEYLDARPGNKELKESSDKYLAEFARLENEEQERRRELERQANDDGFTVVTYKKGSKNVSAAPKSLDTIQTSNGSAYLATMTGSTRKLNDEKNKKTKKQLHFYRFQNREKKVDELAELRSKFEQDKKHLARLKAARKFKPF